MESVAIMMELSAGAVIANNGKYLLLHYQAGHWDFAKGHVEEGETSQEAALREIKEETGLDATIINGFEQRFKFFFRRDGKLTQKEVILYIAKVHSDKVTISNEHIGFAWLPIDEALIKVTFKNSREVLNKAHQWLKKEAVQ